jgi:hypothetical protein
MRWLSVLSPALCGTLLAAAVGAGAAPEAGCDRQTLSLLASPDDAWTALIYQDLCSHGPAFTTVILDRVQLVRRGEESREDSDVLVVEDGGHPENRPLTQWLSPQKLQITIPNRSVVGLRKSSYEGVAVVVKFNPENPAERDRFLKERGLPPD